MKEAKRQKLAAKSQTAASVHAAAPNGSGADTTNGDVKSVSSDSGATASATAASAVLSEEERQRLDVIRLRVLSLCTDVALATPPAATGSAAAAGCGGSGGAATAVGGFELYERGGLADGLIAYFQSLQRIDPLSQLNVLQLFAKLISDSKVAFQALVVKRQLTLALIDAAKRDDLGLLTCGVLNVLERLGVASEVCTTAADESVCRAVCVSDNRCGVMM